MSLNDRAPTFHFIVKDMQRPYKLLNLYKIVKYKRHKLSEKYVFKPHVGNSCLKEESRTTILFRMLPAASSPHSAGPDL